MDSNTSKPLTDINRSTQSPNHPGCPVVQRVGAIDDLIVEIAKAIAKTPPSFPSGLRHCIEQLSLRSEAARVSVLLKRSDLGVATCVGPLHAAARQAHELAKRNGRCDPTLKWLLTTVMHAVERLERDIRSGVQQA